MLFYLSGRVFVNEQCVVQIKVWARPDAYAQTEHALAFGVETYKFFTQYFGIPDSVPKAGKIPDSANQSWEDPKRCTQSWYVPDSSNQSLQDPKQCTQSWYVRDSSNQSRQDPKQCTQSG